MLELEQDLLEECSLFLPMIMNRHLVVLLFSKGYPKESPYFVCKMVLIDILYIANLRNFGIYLEPINDFLGNVISMLDMSDRYRPRASAFKRPDLCISLHFLHKSI